MNSPLHRPRTGVIVTGAASGIGRAIAEALAEVGRPVTIWDVDALRIEEVVTSIASRSDVPVASIALDVRDRAAYSDAIDAAREKMGTIGGFVHCAGVSAPVAIGDLDEESWNLVIDVNLSAMAFLARSLAPDLRRNPESAIVGIASVNAILGNRQNPAYGASKSGMLGLVRSLADEFADDGVRANAVCPGYVRTPMLEAAFEHAPELEAQMERQTMLGRLAAPEDVASVVRFLLSDEARYVTAEHIVVDGGAVRSQR